ncbi:MAG: sulfatase [Verrucomicrobia bacterium]|nr:sulfatase [Verrucomicrobiota bacterium]
MKPNSLSRRLILGVLFGVTMLPMGCHRESARSASPGVIRLHDVFRIEDIKGRLTKEELQVARTAWKFDGLELAPSVTNDAPATFGWRAGPGSSALTVRNGRLVGKSTNSHPIIYLERAAGAEDLDLLHSVEVRMRVSAGTNFGVRLQGGQPPDFKLILEELEAFPWSTRSKLTITNEFQTYVLTPQIFETTSRIKHILFSPTDVADATFEIESIRLVFRQEHLAEIPSSSGWHGLHDIYHEALVTRTPERIELPLNLPAEPRLALSLGTIQDGSVQFQIGIRAGDAPPEKNQWLLKRTVTTPHQWEAIQIDLSRYAGQAVKLTLALEGSSTGLLGFWGSPLVWNMASARQARQQHPERPQGVILIWSDTTRPDHLNFYGYARETAPTLTKLAQAGALFNYCVGQATWTKVATPSLFTSLHPTSHGVHDVPDRLPVSADTMAEVFRRNGYATVSFSALPFTGEASNMHQGFQEVHEGSSLTDTSREGKNAREFVSRALPWLERNRELPFFMFLHLFDAHDPFEPRPPYNTVWAKPGDGETYERMCKKIRPLIEDAGRRTFGKGMLNLAEVKKSGENPDDYIRIEKDWYDGSIRGLDAEVARLRERLQELGLSERVLIVYASDHGEEFFDHGAKLHGHTAYSELNHVALFFNWPGFLPAGKTISVPVRTIDIMPTILELCQIEPPKVIQGQSLLPLILQGDSKSPLRARGARKPQPAITERAPMEGMPRRTESVSIVMDQWKLVHNTVRDSPTAEFELFDWAKDSLDQHNLAAAHPEVVKRLAGELAVWKTNALAAKLTSNSELEKSLSSSDVQRLRALGYLK